MIMTRLNYCKPQINSRYYLVLQLNSNAISICLISTTVGNLVCVNLINVEMFFLENYDTNTNNSNNDDNNRGSVNTKRKKTQITRFEIRSIN